MQKWKNWCALTHGHGMMASDDGAYCLATDVDALRLEHHNKDGERLARIASLSAELADSNEALAACQSQAAGRIADLEQALRDIADPQSYHTIQEMRTIARNALMEKSI
jgi:hypothetical protein